MHFETLDAWLDHTRTVHAKGIDLGLERVKAVASRMGLLERGCPVITVGGTNGKGSCVAGLEAIYLAQGYRVGAFTTPYLFKHNEQVRLQGVEADDEAFCTSFAAVEAAREGVTLTQFEFNTLVALDIFRRDKLDVCLLEVGLGGRLDAVNIMDADVALIASIAIDHVDWLGNTRDLIALEKAGIFRANKPAVCGDFSPPQTLKDYAAEIHTPLFCQNKEFHYLQDETTWSWHSSMAAYENLPIPALAIQNMASVLMAVTLLQERLPVEQQAIEVALEKATLPGRIQVFPGDVTTIMDVSHNPAAAEFLAKRLAKMPCKGKTIAVFSMLSDKDIISTLHVLNKTIDRWYIAELPVDRGASLGVLQDAFRHEKIQAVLCCSDIAKAYQAAKNDAQPGDRIVVFGSFYTVAGVGIVKNDEQ